MTITSEYKFYAAINDNTIIRIYEARSQEEAQRECVQRGDVGQVVLLGEPARHGDEVAIENDGIAYLVWD